MSFIINYVLSMKVVSQLQLCFDSPIHHSVIKIMKAIDIEVDDRDILAGHRIGKSKGNSKKTIVRFCIRKFSKRAL